MATLVGMTIFMPLYFETVLHLSAGQSGLALIPLIGATVVALRRHRPAADVRDALQAHAAGRPHAGACLALALLAIWPVSMPLGAGAGAADGDRRRARHRVSDLHRVHAERGDAASDGHRHRRRQFLPRAVLGAGGGGPGRDRGRRARRRHRHLGGDAGARGLGAGARLCLPLRVHHLRAGAQPSAWPSSSRWRSGGCAGRPRIRRRRARRARRRRRSRQNSDHV